MSATCGCMDDIDAKLKPRNAMIPRNLFRWDYAIIHLEKIDKRDRKTRSPAVLEASFCPFCGVKYDKGSAAASQSTPTPEGQS